MRIMPTSPLSRRPGPSWLEARRRLLIGLTGLLLVLVAGTIGYLGFGLSLLDAVFQTVITVSTVGFGEARPFSSGEKVFTIVLILVGVATAAYTFGVGIDTLVEGRCRRPGCSTAGSTAIPRRTAPGWCRRSARRRG
jgi:voltage-gated potassium channel